MNKNAICCERCFAKIAKKNIEASKLWMNICDVQLSKPNGLVYIYRLHNKDLEEEPPELRVLEQSGYILSTDTDRCIKIKVYGFHVDLSGGHFCIGNCSD